VSRAIKPKIKAAPSIRHEDATIASLKKDRMYAAEYLNQVFEDGDQEEVLLALRRMADAFGGVSKLARSTKLNATSLYRTLSAHGNPELKNMSALLKAMGLRLAVRPMR